MTTPKDGPDSRTRPVQFHPGYHPRRSEDRQIRGARAHALSSGAERISARRPRQVDQHQLRPRARVRRKMQPALRRHQPVQGRDRVRRFDHRRRALAGRRFRRPAVLRLGLFRPALRMGGAADPEGQSLRLRPHRRPGPPAARHADRARPGEPLPQPHDRGKSRPVRPHAQGRISRRIEDPAGQGRHGVAQSQHARSGAVPDSAHGPSPHGRQVVHLSDVRLHARAVGFDRAHHAFHLHSGV